MIDRPVVAVTGATGRLGGRVARRLANLNVPQRLVVRDPERAPELPGAVVAQASFDDRDAVSRALDTIDRVLMVSAAETPNRVDQHRAFIDAAASAGVRHVVYISFSGAAPNATFTLARDHWATEEYLRVSGMAFTILQDNLYADFLPFMVGDDAVIRGPAGQGRAAVVAQDDIADAATAVLLDPSPHVGATYSLTGPEALTFDEIAAILTDVTGRLVKYRSETIEEAYRSRERYGAPAWQVDAWVSTYTAIAAGEMAAVTDAIPRLTRHRATALRDLLARTS
jgi:NAD(P)H dehydrogenase (quinone)